MYLQLDKEQTYSYSTHNCNFSWWDIRFSRRYEWLSSGMFRRVVSQILTEISEALTASIIMMVIVLMMDYTAQHTRRLILSSDTCSFTHTITSVSMVCIYKEVWAWDKQTGSVATTASIDNTNAVSMNWCSKCESRSYNLQILRLIRRYSHPVYSPMRKV
jgi:hypothetical protein